MNTVIKAGVISRAKWLPITSIDTASHAWHGKHLECRQSAQRNIHTCPKFKPRVAQISRLQHSPRLVAIGPSVGYETLPPTGWYHPFGIGWSEYTLGLRRTHCIVGSCDQWECPPVYWRHWQYLRTVLTAELPAVRTVQRVCERVWQTSYWSWILNLKHMTSDIEFPGSNFWILNLITRVSLKYRPPGIPYWNICQEIV